MLTYRIKMRGNLQGVGFRPAVYCLAQKLNITGTVINKIDHVEITIQNLKSINSFCKELKTHLPKQAYIDDIKVEKFILKRKFRDFKIVQTTAKNDKSLFPNIPADMKLCEKCISELKNKNDMRYSYPFITCTDCGPRFSIIKQMPYDRKNTTMQKFPLCDYCKKEYKHPKTRRFHAETLCCEKCGPNIDVENIIDNIKNGEIVAIKGIGGFHIICDATNIEALNKLRHIKKRYRKPLAIMFNNIFCIRKHCCVSKREENLLLSNEAPIVLLEKRNKMFEASAPNTNKLGVILAYTPLHYLITEHFPNGIVCTSANLNSDPIIYDDISALKKITQIIYDHDRAIITPIDDSILVDSKKRIINIRRSRGFIPNIENINLNLPSILALGTELKNTFALGREKQIIVSQHIGDLKNINCQERQEKLLTHFFNLYQFKPEYIVVDLHPDFILNDMAKNFSVPIIRIQHHHAHMCSCMFESKLNEDVLGVIWDGVGFGLDGNLWGGEFLYGNYKNVKRIAHFDYIPLPGGDICTKDIWRLKDDNLPIIKKMIESKINTPYSSAVGRLFDKVAASLNIINECEFEGEAAILLEQLATDTNDRYEFQYINGKISIDINDIISDNNPISIKSMKFHNTLIEVISHIASFVGVRKIALSGGCFANLILLNKTIEKLGNKGIKVYSQQRYPCGDGGVSLGQIIAGFHQIR